MSLLLRAQRQPHADLVSALRVRRRPPRKHRGHQHQRLAANAPISHEIVRKSDRFASTTSQGHGRWRRKSRSMDQSSRAGRQVTILAALRAHHTVTSRAVLRVAQLELAPPSSYRVRLRRRRRYRHGDRRAEEYGEPAANRIGVRQNARAIDWLMTAAGAACGSSKTGAWLLRKPANEWHTRAARPARECASRDELGSRGP